MCFDESPLSVRSGGVVEFGCSVAMATEAVKPLTLCLTDAIVYFGKDVSNLTSSAIDTVSHVVSCVKQKGAVHVSIVGHATLRESQEALENEEEGESAESHVGVPGYARALSERRAQASKDEMVLEGLDWNIIQTSGVGMRLEAPELDEERNRFAEVTVTR